MSSTQSAAPQHIQFEIRHHPSLQILGVLNAKWFPAFSRSPVALLKTALGFSVSSRLVKYQADYEAQQAALAEPADGTAKS